MDYAEDYLKPTPSDFGDYAYCGAKWILKKTRPIKRGSLSQKRYNLEAGIRNEIKCINWVLKKYGVTNKQIIFNGINENNTKFLSSVIESRNIVMECKPDLIIRVNNRNLLFEFKAVSLREYLSRNEFSSVHAQIWCYTHLKDIHIDEYHLLRYFIDPDIDPQHKEIKYSDSYNYEFDQLFGNYISAVNIYNEKKPYGNLGNKEMLNFLNPPKEMMERFLKCKGCRYNIYGYCYLGKELINK